MSAKSFYIVSDLHLGAVPPQTERAFRDFLAFAARTASGLLINGDLFDFWFEYRTVILREHFRVLARLAEVVEAGLPVWFVGGNHDAWAGDVLARDVGVRVMEGPVMLNIAGRRALVAHGDGVGAGDLGYRALRRVIRSPLAVRAFRALHPDLGGRIAGLASSTHAKAEDADPGSKRRAERIEDWAVEVLRSRNEVEMVVAGHAHRACVREVAPGRFYLNAGDWLHRWNYLALPPAPAAPELRSWPAPSDST